MNENSRGFRILELSAARKVQEEKNKRAYQNGVVSVQVAVANGRLFCSGGYRHQTPAFSN